MSSVYKLPIAEYRTKFELARFVETGSYLGDGIQAALDAGYLSAQSCDISKVHYDHCRRRFHHDRRVELFFGESLGFLSHLGSQNRSPTLFWLDAHFPGFYGFGEFELRVGRFPLLAELQLLSRFPGIERDVILADDLRVLADGANPRWRPGELDEYFVIRDLKFKELVSTLASTHAAEVFMEEEGILALFPKVRRG